MEKFKQKSEWLERKNMNKELTKIRARFYAELHDKDERLATEKPGTVAYPIAEHVFDRLWLSGLLLMGRWMRVLVKYSSEMRTEQWSGLRVWRSAKSSAGRLSCRATS